MSTTGMDFIERKFNYIPAVDSNEIMDKDPKRILEKTCLLDQSDISNECVKN